MFINYRDQSVGNKKGIVSQCLRSKKLPSFRIDHAFGTLLFLIALAVPMVLPAKAREIDITGKRYAFEPAEITVKKGEAIELVLKSSDVTHGIRIRELGIDFRAQKGKEARISFVPKATGTFVGHCSVFCGSGHGQMTLTIHLVS